MFNASVATRAVEELGFCYMGRTPAGLSYFSGGHSVLICDDGAIHTTPSGATKVYRSHSNVRAYLARSLAWYRLRFVLGLCGLFLLSLLVLFEGWVDVLFTI